MNREPLTVNRQLSTVNLIKHIENFAGKKILVIGDVMLDEYLWGQVERISPEAPVPLIDVEKETVGVGGAANVSANILSMGGQPILAGVVGDDQAGETMKTLLIEMGIDNNGIFSCRDRPTTRKTRVIAGDQQLVRIDKENRSEIEGSVKDQLWDFIMEKRGKIDAVLIEDYNKGLLDKELIKQILTYFKGSIISVDPKFDNFFDYKDVTIFKPNKREIEKATGQKFVSSFPKEIIAEAVREKIKCKNLVLTLGRDGMLVIGEEGKRIISHKAMVEVHDESGAGDTVISALTLSLTTGADIYESALIASYAAGIEVGKVGVIPVQREELIASVETTDHRPQTTDYRLQTTDRRPKT